MQGKPTEAMKECRPLDYGELSSKDYLPGAELLQEGTDEPQDQGKAFQFFGGI